MTDEDRQFNEKKILDMCELGDRLLDLYVADILRIVDGSTAAERCGMTEAQYRHAESLYLHGDLSGR